MSVMAACRRTARSIPRAIDKLAHPLRRKHVRSALKRQGLPQSVLFICHGNICRSPYAAAAFAHALPSAVRETMRVDSAGFIGPGRPPPREAIAVAARRGIDISAHQSRSVAAELLLAAELVVVMDGRQRALLRRLYDCNSTAIVVLGDLDPDPIMRRAILDPVGQSEAVFDSSYTRIDRCVSALLGMLDLA